MLSRRKFIQSGLSVAAAATIATPPSFGSRLFDWRQPIRAADAVDLAEFRNMQRVVDGALQSRSVLRKILMTDELPKGALPRYKGSCDTHLVVTTNPLETPQLREPISFAYGDEVVLPTWQAAYPRELILDTPERRTQATLALIEHFTAVEKEVFIRLTQYWDEAKARPAYDHTGKRVKESTENRVFRKLNRGFCEIEQHDLVCVKMIVTQNGFDKLTNHPHAKNFFDVATEKERMVTGLAGQMFTADMHIVDDPRLEGFAYLAASPDCVGAFAIRQDMTILPHYSARLLGPSCRCTAFYDIAVSIINTYAVTKVKL